ncbi:hypothetical protein [Candidatus Uabimicrobium amorphum]|uniref:Uncharacterized protein n=1 Tax=Uabimicrobium amorphum TaxID=2596890 RepID=A0A5S9IU15_UABAM|nr:hypothetical protein [Candidatus Uabimicrobium amorphum]BBM88138.1 hypothetical protein UABAM_06554 [Candidatus Uabimicrobium amorphum]
MKCDEFRDKKHQEISSMVRMMHITPSKNFKKNLYKALHHEDTSFWEKFNLIFDYAIYRFVHTPVHTAWMSFLIITTIALPICYFNYMENQIQNQQQALPLWKMPAQITANK